MRNFIVVLLAWLLGVFAPGTGKRRATMDPAVPASEQRPEAPLSTALRLPAHRSPYGLHPVLDGETAAMVRPYVIVWKRERASHERALQHRRRTALVLVPDLGVDLDRHLIGAEAVAR
ncbi:hypothetical protein [Streptomyces tailanensis]|uniref:hypothetical protein n=1 Tax=Streptomyces tailanensis TaxID=2569858 RepID=UPI00122E1D54|nr:hypothetical protein [Streptomyces tailanensis]